MGFRAGHRRLAAALGLGVCLVAGNAAAMGLGAAAVNSGLGEPLRMSFPVSIQSGEEVGCVQVRSKGDDLPGVLNTRTTVIRNGFQTRIEVRSILPVFEPAVGLVVTVGCASPISREYVVFLDPPIVGPVAETLPEAAPTMSPARVERPAPSRRASAPSSGSSATPTRRSPSTPAPVRAPRVRTPAAPTAPVEAPQASTQPALQPPVAAAPPRASKGGDRLTVVPTETAPTAIGPGADAPPPGRPGAPAPAPTEAATPAVPPVAATSPPAPDPTAASEAAVREQALRQQQAEMQRQVKLLGDQIAELKLQTATLTTRNQALEQVGFAPWLLWLLIALAVIAIVVAAWMAWRYTQLRRSIEGAAWWTGNTGFAPPEGGVAVETRGGVVTALDPGTRLAPRPTTPTDVRPATSMAPVASVSNVERPRPIAPRPQQRYPTPIDTDFTVSDIEAAMATVRTVSPPRDASRPPPVEDSDFAPLGGPTLPSPFTEPPPPVVSRNEKVVERDGDDLGKFVDLEIPPLPPSTRLGPISSPSATRSVPTLAEPYEETEALDFKLDIPNSFDPLATDSMKTTVFDRPAPDPVIDFELPPSSATLDFDLPESNAVKPLGAPVTDRFADDSPTRHGATALNDLFASQDLAPGIDTILNLDERDGSPLSTTEVDRLTTTAVEAPHGDALPLSTRAMLARFADLLNQVDETEESDPLRAIAMLRQYVLRDEKIPTLLWLRLFVLYRKVDKKPVYEALAEHFARRYHRPMVTWGQTLADRVPQTPLSAMGPVDREIEMLWGKDEGLERIRSLLCDRDQDDAIVFNAVLQRDLLDAAKVFPPGPDSQVES